MFRINSVSLKLAKFNLYYCIFLGNWSRDLNDDLMLPDGSIRLRPSQSLSMRDIHNNFGQYWRLKETHQENIGHSLFWHDVVPFSRFDDRSFEPKFELDDTNIDPDEIDRICSNSAACIYDFITTGDANYATHTRNAETMAEIMHKTLDTEVIRCPALPKPLHGRKSENRYWPGTIVR